MPATILDTTGMTAAALREGLAVLIFDPAAAAEAAISQAAVLEMANHGFLLDPRMLDGATTESLTGLVAAAREITAGDRDMAPIFPGFPQQVRASETVDLLVEQILHYLSGGEFVQGRGEVAAGAALLREGTNLADLIHAARSVTVLDEAQAPAQLIEKLLTRTVTLSPNELRTLEAAVAVGKPSVEELLAAGAKAANDENLGVLIRAVVSHGQLTASGAVLLFAPAAKSLRALLRVVLSAAATVRPEHTEAGERAIGTLHSGSAYSITLASLSRPARRALIKRLGELSGGYRADRLIADQALWRRVLRGVHPYSQIQLTEAARRACDIVTGNLEHRTLASTVEEAYEGDDTAAVIGLLAAERPGELLRELVRILRTGPGHDDVEALVGALRATVRTDRSNAVALLVSAYNGVLAANHGGPRLSRVAGRSNHVVDTERALVSELHLATVREALLELLVQTLRNTTVAPETASVGTGGEQGSMAVPLVRRDLSDTDRALHRGARLDPVGQGQVLRVFSHWRNTHSGAGYLDIGVVVLDEDFERLAVSTWDTWGDNREWSTYSGDCLVQPGGSAAEYIDVDLAALRRAHPSARWAVMTVQSYSGIPLDKVDMIAGTMLRSDRGESGPAFEPRAVTSAFSPTTSALQAVPLMVAISGSEAGTMVWLDTSSGSGHSGVSASRDELVEVVVRDEFDRPRLSVGELAELWARAHGVEADPGADVDVEAVVGLVG